MNLLHFSHFSAQSFPWLCPTQKARVMACDLALSPPDLSNPDSPPQRPHSSPASLLAVSRTLQACSDFSVQKPFPHSSLLQVTLKGHFLNETPPFNHPILNVSPFNSKFPFPLRNFGFFYETGCPSTCYQTYLFTFFISLFQIQ